MEPKKVDPEIQIENAKEKPIEFFNLKLKSSLMSRIFWYKGQLSIFQCPKIIWGFSGFNSNLAFDSASI